ncbi:MAG: hypothetical protein ACI97A_000703 [Planctomycetota bacterium]|jgi:hypothetical protein
MTRILTVLLLAQLSLAAQATPAQLDIAIEAAGPHAIGSHWVNRENNAKLIDLLSTNPIWAPVLGPGNPFGWFLANLYRLRWGRTTTRLATPFVNSSKDLRLTKLYSSSWICENDLFTWGTDVVESPFGTYGFAGAVGTNEIGFMADELDMLFVTHTDSDHFSASLVTAMLMRNKPIICTSDLAALATAAGAPANLLIVPTTGINTITVNNRPFTFGCYNGFQRLGSPIQVQCNAYRFKTATGRTIIHSGDVEDAGYARHISRENWFADFLLNAGAAQIYFDYRFLSHELEYTHFGSGFLLLNMPPTGPTSNKRYVLLWGESIEL